MGMMIEQWVVMMMGIVCFVYFVVFVSLLGHLSGNMDSSLARVNAGG